LLILISVLGTSSLASTLKEDGNVTLFVPTDAAFKKHKDILNTIMNDQTCLDSECFQMLSLPG